MSEALPPEILIELQREYLQGFDEHFSNIKSAHENKDWAKLEEIFHKFVGSGTTYEFPNITEVARTLETYFAENAQPEEEKVIKGIRFFQKVVSDYKTQFKQINSPRRRAR